MRLKEFLDKMHYASDAVISITGICDKYNEGVLSLMDEELFIEHQNDEIAVFDINQGKEPELRIYLKEEFPDGEGYM